ncbi:MAG: ABC transporter permease [Bacillota bacterium]|nr:ABC transporter permease [Bacillota bacterium]
MLSLAKRVIQQIIGDKRTLALIIFAPLLLLTLLYFLLGNTTYTPTIAIKENALSPAFVSQLKSEDVKIVDISSSNENANDYLKNHKDVDAVLEVSKLTGANITMFESSVKSGKAMEVIQTAIQNTAKNIIPIAKVNINYVYGNTNDSTFSSLGFVFLGILSFFFVFIISGMALVRERSSGTLERLLMTPIRRRQVILGYSVGYSVFAVIQAILIVLYCIYVLKIHCEGNALWVILVMVLMAISAVVFGAMISIFSHSEFQVVQFIPIVLVPQIFFSGLIPLDTIPYYLGNLCYITPVYYGCTAIKRVMVEGGGFCDIWMFIVALLAYTFILCVLNTLALKKYRKL